jgi:hypothetical protein
MLLLALTLVQQHGTCQRYQAAAHAAGVLLLQESTHLHHHLAVA